MPRVKKKKSRYYIEKLHKAQYKNEFIYKLSMLCNTISGKNILQLIPANNLEVLYHTRCRSVKFVAAEGHIIPENVINNIKWMVSKVLKKHRIQITSDGKEMILNDYFTIGFTLLLYIRKLTETDFKNALELKNALEPFNQFSQHETTSCQMLHTILHTYSLMNSNIHEKLYGFEQKVKLISDGSSGVQNLIEIYTHVPEKINIFIEGKSRPAYKVGWAFPQDDVQWIKIKPIQLGLANSFSEIPMEVYIQSHALHRLTERIDCFDIGTLHFNLFLSLNKLENVKNRNGNILIEYRLFDARAGYLCASIIDGVILIKTFLLLINSGTPEGQKFEEICGMEKLDKKYLGIDKLSAFMSSDIGENKVLRSIFKRADLTCLLELYEKLNTIVIKKAEQQTAELLEWYLKKDKLEEVFKKEEPLEMTL